MFLSILTHALNHLHYFVFLKPSFCHPIDYFNGSDCWVRKWVNDFGHFPEFHNGKLPSSVHPA